MSYGHQIHYMYMYILVLMQSVQLHAVIANYQLHVAAPLLLIYTS